MPQIFWKTDLFITWLDGELFPNFFNNQDPPQKKIRIKQTNKQNHLDRKTQPCIYIPGYAKPGIKGAVKEKIQYSKLFLLLQ